LPRWAWMIVLLSTIPFSIHQRLLNPELAIITSHVDAFGIGALLGIGVQWLEQRRRIANPLLMVCVIVGFAYFLPQVIDNYRAGYVDTKTLGYAAWMATAGVFMAAGWIGLLAINREAPLLSWLRWPPLVHLGVISYPLYLVHFPIVCLFPKLVYKMTNGLGLPMPPAFVVQSIIVLICLGLAQGLYQKIDKRLQAGRTGVALKTARA